jgi:organic hydroperoxide reductase OsmC/OhrA
MTHRHHYAIDLAWTGNRGAGTGGHRTYSRDYEIRVPGKPVLPGSSDPAFRGDAGRYNPEELLLAALSACHMLWYLHLASEAGIVVTAYEDKAEAEMVEDEAGGGRFTSATLKPRVTVAPGTDLDRARALHETAHRRCFIANSVNFKVKHRPSVSHTA